MDVMGIPWAGSMAVRGDLFRDAKIAERWSHAIVDDASLRLLLKQRRFCLKFVPTLMHADFDDASVPNILNFLVRQMTWTRLYARDAWLVVWFCTVVTLLPLTASTVLTIAALYTRNWPLVAWSMSGIAVYHLVSFLGLGMLDSSIHHALRRQYTTLRWSWPKWPRMYAFAPLAAVLHVPAFLSSLCKRRFTWRGVTYQVHSPWDIRIENFDAIPATREPQSSTVNL
jgi:hypothetical protein